MGSCQIKTPIIIQSEVHLSLLQNDNDLTKTYQPNPNRMNIYEENKDFLRTQEIADEEDNTERIQQIMNQKTRKISIYLEDGSANELLNSTFVKSENKFNKSRIFQAQNNEQDKHKKEHDIDDASIYSQQEIFQKNQNFLDISELGNSVSKQNITSNESEVNIFCKPPENEQSNEIYKVQNEKIQIIPRSIIKQKNRLVSRKNKSVSFALPENFELDERNKFLKLYFNL